jgi:hypothetical protein
MLSRSKATVHANFAEILKKLRQGRWSRTYCDACEARFEAGKSPTGFLSHEAYDQHQLALQVILNARPE